MIRIVDNSIFILETKDTSYIFKVLPTGQLEHLYYGKHLTIPEGKENDCTIALIEKHAFAPGNTNTYDAEHPEYSLEDMRLEMSSLGKGDIREPLVCIKHEDGNSTSDFVFEAAKIVDGTIHMQSLPSSYDENGKAKTLMISLRDKSYGEKLILNYVVYEDCDVITRNSVLVNESENQLEVNRLLSMQFDFDYSGYVVSSFHGAWAREMHRNDTPINAGKFVISSATGTTSSRANPFVMMHKADTNEDLGEVYAFNLVYSGNHYESIEVSPFGKTRFSSGINPEFFRYILAPGEMLEAPEAVMTYSNGGYNAVSGNMHSFVREHIVRGNWKHKDRPVLLNSWEAAYFDINESKLLKLAKAGKELGIELFVMDDGWFGERNDDTSSLGDWYVNTKKLPHGLNGLAEKINNLGMDFGIWVEPEMVNEKSKLYENHPEWVIEVPGKHHSEGRNQRILDLSNVQVQDYIIDEMSKIFSSANISYVKWDMNRTFTDYYSQSLSTQRQGELSHRYVCGLYRCMKTLVERFPNILFEGCSAGGNRFDLGVLSYFPQIWASDDTDALCRLSIQTGYSYGYPMSTVSAHVSACPNHQTLRTTPLDTRFGVAAFGVLGYECNLCDMKKEELAQIKAQIDLYKKWRPILQWGKFYRGDDKDNLSEWTCVSEDGSKAVGFIMQKLVMPNSPFHSYHAKGLKEASMYHFYNNMLKIDIRKFGDLVNTSSPIHLKQDSLLLDIVAKYVKMDGESEDINASGDVLMHGGVHLKQAFGATGYSENVRYFQDFGSRLYFMEEI